MAISNLGLDVQDDLLPFLVARDSHGVSPLGTQAYSIQTRGV